MPKIMSFRRKEEPDDMKEYTRKLLRHRMSVAGRIAACVLLVLVILLGSYWYSETCVYTEYEVVSSVEHMDSLNTRYMEYEEQLLRYSKDGISCLNLSYEPVWSQTFNMQNPMLKVCKNAVAIADQGGNQIYLFNKDGLTGQIDTLLPIQQVTVSRQGVIAVLLEDSDVSWIYLYDAEGNLLIDARCNLAETGQPLSLSLAPDGSKLAVSYLQIAGGTANSCIVFYNLGSVGANFLDKIVASRVYENLLVPRVEYLDEDTCVAASEKGFYLYEGAEIPEETKSVIVEEEIKSVVFGSGKFALVHDQSTEHPFLMRVFDEKGEVLQEQLFDLRYSQIKLSDKEVLIYNDSECLIYNKKGILRYEGSFEDPLVNLYKLKGHRYVAIHPKQAEQIKLR